MEWKPCVQNVRYCSNHLEKNVVFRVGVVKTNDFALGDVNILKLGVRVRLVDALKIRYGRGYGYFWLEHKSPLVVAIGWRQKKIRGGNRETKFD